MSTETTNPAFTPEAVKDILLGAGFTEYDHDEPATPGFEVFRVAYGAEIIALLQGPDLIRYNPGEGPRALLDDYFRVLGEAGYKVRSTGSEVVVAGLLAPEGER